MKYLGIDIGGMNKTYICTLQQTGKTLSIESLERATLQRAYKLAINAKSVAIDAQLTFDINCENGFRGSDDCLREYIEQYDGNQAWVASYNSLMAVPIRGKILFDELIQSGKDIKVYETHPRANLLFKLPDLIDDIISYKGRNEQAIHSINTLKENWLNAFNIVGPQELLNNINNDGLDALVCATIAYLATIKDTVANLTRDNGNRELGDFLVIKPPNPAE